jgi:hypothetical protein
MSLIDRDMEKIYIPGIFSDRIGEDIFCASGKKKIELAGAGKTEQFCDILSQKWFSTFETGHQYRRTGKIFQNLFYLFSGKILNRILFDITEATPKMASGGQLERCIKRVN